MRTAELLNVEGRGSPERSPAGLLLQSSARRPRMRKGLRPSRWTFPALAWMLAASVGLGLASGCAPDLRLGEQEALGGGGAAGSSASAGLGGAGSTGTGPGVGSGGEATGTGGGDCADGTLDGDETDVDCGGSCPSPCEQGQGCDVADDCATQSCVDGVCCDAACDGPCDACSAARKGSGEDGACGLAAVGMECGDPPSCTNGVETTAGSCDGAGSCQDGGVHPCAPYTCGATACNTSCSGSSECDPTHFCAGSQQCVPKLVVGDMCATANQCESGFCADGRCCNSACGGACDVCSAALGAPANGTCTNVAGYGGNPSCGAYVCSASSASCPTTCAGDMGCAVSNYCNSSNHCTPKIVFGGMCTTDNQCQSGFCADGRCCNIACGGACDVCSVALGAPADGFCTNTEGYSGNPSCGAYLCKVSSSVCPTICTLQPDCASGFYCDGTGHCAAQSAQGQPCVVSEQCLTGVCADGVCCAGPCNGTCMACSAAKTGGTNGVCAFVSAGGNSDGDCIDEGATSCGNNGRCNGTGACQQYAAGTLCSAGMCTGGTGVDPADQCNGSGTCVVTIAQDCWPYACNSPTGLCFQSCANDTQCAPDQYCDGVGSCQAKKILGELCTAPNQCSSNECVDGVCCDTACNSPCQACTAALKGSGFDGTCGQAASGTQCAAPMCDADGVTLNKADTCAAGGVCTDNGTMSCAPYACVTSACLSNCVSDLQCAPGAYCSSNGSCLFDTVLILGGGTGGNPMVGAAFHPGGSWTTQTTMSGATTDVVALALDATGRGVGLMHQTSAPGTDELRYTTWNPMTEMWASFSTISGVTTGAKPSIASASNASAAAYQQAGNANYRYASFNGAWTPTAEVTSASGAVGRAAEIAVIPSTGNVGLVYVNGTSVEFRERIAGAWGAAFQLYSAGVASNTAPAIVAMNGGTANLMVVYTDSSGHMFSRRRIGTTFQSAAQIGTNVFTTANQVALAALPSGTAVVAYRSNASGLDGRLYTSFYSGSAWSTPAAYGSVTINGSPAVAHGVGYGANAAFVELAWVQVIPSAINHTRCTIMGASACTTWTNPVVLSAVPTTVAIASVP